MAHFIFRGATCGVRVGAGVCCVPRSVRIPSQMRPAAFAADQVPSSGVLVLLQCTCGGRLRIVNCCLWGSELVEIRREVGTLRMAAMASVAVAAVAPSGVGAPSLRLSCKSALGASSNVSSIAFGRNANSRTVCSAGAPGEEKEKEQSAGEAAGRVATALALAAIVGSAPFVAPKDAMADIAGLTPCKESKAFAKREKQEIKKLTGRLKLYAPDSAPALAIQATIEKTKRRFAFYGNEGLLCGTDGLPHLIVDGDQAHLGEFVYPGVVFLYIAGWIGWVGRSYLIQVRDDKKPTEKEIIIDVPLATSLLWKGLTWPVAALSELRTGKLIEEASKITVSPR